MKELSVFVDESGNYLPIETGAEAPALIAELMHSVHDA